MFVAQTPPTVHDTLTIPIQSALRLRADTSVQASSHTRASPQPHSPDTDFIRLAERVPPARLLTRSGLLTANLRLRHTIVLSFQTAEIGAPQSRSACAFQQHFASISIPGR